MTIQRENTGNSGGEKKEDRNYNCNENNTSEIFISLSLCNSNRTHGFAQGISVVNSGLGRDAGMLDS